MADFSLQDLWWLKPKGPDNPLPALQLGVNIAQHRAQQDLQEGELANQIARTSLMRQEMMFKQKIQLSMMEGQAEQAEAIASITDWTDPEQTKRVAEVGAKYPITVGNKAWLGAEYMQRNAINAKTRADNTQSLIARRAAQTELANLEQARKDLLADSTVDLNDARILNINERLALGQQKQALEEQKLELQSILADSTVDVNDARIAKFQQDLGMAERRILIQEGNLALRSQELGQKGRRLDARAQTGYNNELKALNEEEKAKLKLAETDPAETDRLRKLYNLRRRGITERFYGPATTNAPAPKVTREGVQTEDRTTNAPPAVVAPDGNARAAEIRESFRAGKITKEQAMEQLRELGFK